MPDRANCSWCATSPIWCRPTRRTANSIRPRRRSNSRCRACKVRNIVVMGHGRCGGIGAALNPGAAPLSPGDFIGKWMSLVEPAAQAVSGNTLMTAAERQTALERISIRFSIANLQDISVRQHPRRQGQAVAARRMVRHLDRRALGDEPRDRRFRAARPRLSASPASPRRSLFHGHRSPCYAASGKEGYLRTCAEFRHACLLRLRQLVLGAGAVACRGQRRHHHALVFDAGGRQ